MAEKIKLTRPELKRQRDVLVRFERYLPMLKLKQQQLQLTLQEILQQRQKLEDACEAARTKFEPYSGVLRDVAGVDVRRLSEVTQVRTSTANIAGISVPVFEDVSFPEARYSLFATPTWVDKALADMRQISRQTAELQVLDRQCELIRAELTKITQRVNLFEKVRIPEARENIRRIRIRLGDELTAAVGRAKIAKSKLTATGVSGRQLYALPDGINGTRE